MLVRRLFLTVFCGLRNVHFQCYCGQLKFNRIVLVLKLLSMTSYIIVKSLVQIPFVESSLWRIQMLVRRRSLTVFCGLRKVRFQCYCVQIKFNRIFLVLKLLSTTFYIIVETLAQIPFVEASLWRFKKLFRRPFLTVFCGLRQVRFHCYCAELKFNRIVLVLKLLSMTFYIIVKSLVQIPFVESSLWRIQMLVRRPSLTVFADYAKYVSNATVLSSSSIEFFLCSNYFQRPFLSSLKLWLRYLSQNLRYGGLKNWFEDLFSQFLRITQSTFPMLLCSVQVQSYCSGAQTTFNGLLYRREKFGLHYGFKDSNYGSNAFCHNFLRITPSTFPLLLCGVKVQSNCSSAQTTFNDLLYHR